MAAVVSHFSRGLCRSFTWSLKLTGEYQPIEALNLNLITTI